MTLTSADVLVIDSTNSGLERQYELQRIDKEADLSLCY